MEKTLENVRKAFPEGEQIADAALREKVYRTWLKVWEASGIESLETISFLPGILSAINNVEHTRDVTRMSIHMAKLVKESFNIEVNMDYLIAGAILHDIGKAFRFSATPSPEGKLLGHAFSAAYVAIKEDLPLEVVHIIATHSKEGDLIKRTTEGDIVHYMDQAHAAVLLRARGDIDYHDWHDLLELRKLLRFDGITPAKK